MLGDVRRAVLDFPAMADRGRRMVQIAGAGAARYADDEVDETVAFLEWLLQDHFIFLGYREYKIDDESIAVVPGSGLGILADEDSSKFARPQPIASLPPDMRERALEGDLLIVSKTNRLSTVHRRVRMDYVGVRKVSADGRITGEARMLGLFTTKAYAEPASQTPLLNRKLRQILRHEDLIEGSHDYKAAVSLFDSFPKDELFSARSDDLRRAVVALLSLEGDRVRLLGRVLVRRPLGVADRRRCPRRATTPSCSRRSRALLRERFGTEAVDTHTVLGEGERVRVHATVHVPDGVPDVSLRELEQELISLTRTWEDGLRERLVDRFGPTRGRELAAKLGAALPRVLPRVGRPGDGRRRRRLLRPARARGASRSSSGCRTSPGARASRSTRPAARSSWARRCRRSRTSGCAWSRRSRRACSAATATPGCRTSACSARATARSTSPTSASGSPTASPPCAAATPSRTRSTGSSSSRG